MAFNMMNGKCFTYSTTSRLAVFYYNYLPCISYMAIHIQFLRNY